MARLPESHDLTQTCDNIIDILRSRPDLNREFVNQILANERSLEGVLFYEGYEKQNQTLVIRLILFSVCLLKVQDKDDENSVYIKFL